MGAPRLIRAATLHDVPEIAALINDPSIRDAIGGVGRLDPRPFLADPRNRLFFDERGGAAFAWHGPGVFDGHAFFKARGREALSAAAECLAHMDDARIIWGLVPTDNRPMRWFARKLGFVSLGLQDTPLGRRELFTLEK
jgi:hypothetical protein